MQGQRGAEKPFADTRDLNQGSNCPNQSTNCDNRLYPMENHNLQSLDGWHIGESSSSTNPNPQSHILGGESTRAPLSFNLNAEHMESGSDNNDVFPYNVENDGALSFKRKSLEGEAIDGSSNIGTYLPPVRQSEELNLQIGIGHGITPDVFPPITVTETGESSTRTYNIRANQDNDRINLPSTRNVMSLSEFRARSQMIHAPESIHTPESSRNVPPFSFHGSRNLRGGESLTSSFNSAERDVSSRQELNLESFTRNSVERSPSTHGRRNSGSHSPSPWGTHHRHGSSRNLQRSSQFYPWAPFPSSDSLSSNFPPLRSGQSSEEDIVMPPGTNQGHNRHNTQLPRPSMMTELQGDDISEWHALAADIEGRQRLVSEIRNVLNSMRRGDNLRDEDYMLFDPFINGIAEFHDRHRDMRLDVDNMSYEELLALEERMGDVNTGLSEDAILKSMKQRKHLCLFDRSSSSLEPCSICREEYVLGDNIGELDCGHDFHSDCVKQWLTQKNLCPICKTTALGT